MGRNREAEVMAKLTGWKTGLAVAVFVAWPLIATAQGTQTGGQQPPAQGSAPPPSQPANPQQPQPTNPQQPPANPQQPTQSGSQGGFGQGQGQGDNVRQIALGHLTAARQDLADVTKLPAAAQIQGQARTELNNLISNFNALITSNGPEWRQAYDRVQSTLSTLVGGAPPAQPGQAGEASQSAVGTSGAAPAAALDPSIVAKLNDMRLHVNEFGQTVGIKPGQSAVEQENAQPGTAGTAGAAANGQALRNVDQIGSILSRVLSQASPDQPTVTVNRQDLQQIQEYLNQLRQSLQGPIR
jgi:hypothetical protein